MVSLKLLGNVLVEGIQRSVDLYYHVHRIFRHIRGLSIFFLQSIWMVPVKTLRLSKT